MAASVLETSDSIVCNLILGYLDEIPPRYQKVRDAVGEAMKLDPDLIVRRGDQLIHHKVVYLSPQCITFTQVKNHLMAEVHSNKEGQEANKELVEARKLPKSLLVVENWPAPLFRVEQKLADVNRNLILKGDAYSKWACSWVQVLGWDKKDCQGYRLATLLQENEPDEQQVVEVERGDDLLTMHREFPERTKTMVATLKHLKKYSRLFLTAGVGHLLVFEQIKDPNLDLTLLYECLRDRAAIVTYPLCIGGDIRMYPMHYFTNIEPYIQEK